ncbi:DsbA family protein [Brevundimonas subvibrioides]|uniref:DsbA family protein n=1 Tax=Brevundimonas subvibrioides TaxID=74313 RepID=UPI0022B53B5C|nr:DsbA family protein [Brevundimonas subvibrioides]
MNVRNLCLAFLALTLSACGGGSRAPAEGDMAMGAAEGAKVTVVEYASPTCPHCALWQQNTWPAFKAAYVDTNKVRYVFRELPTPPTDIAAAGFLLARCAGPDKYFDVIHAIMESQSEWRTGTNPRDSLIRIAGGVGIDQAAFTACVTDPKAIAALETRVKAATDAGVINTPTFLVNGTRVASPGGEGTVMADLAPAIDAELAK